MASEMVALNESCKPLVGGNSVGKWGRRDYLALDLADRVIAWARTPETVKNKAIALGVFTPLIIPGWFVENHKIPVKY